MAAPVFVCVWYDTEDFLTPSSDDSALRLAQLHSRLALPATFKVVGEKARRLLSRGRHDVLAALRQHDLGYHTDLHSVHPVIPEYCEPLPWEDGVRYLDQLETAGCRDVETILGGPLSTFGQAGGAWAPQIYPVLRQWGIPTYVDEGDWIGLDERPFWFMGVLHAFRLGHNVVRFNLRQPGDELDGCARYHEAVRRLQRSGGGVVSIYFHPTEWNTDEWWDGINWGGGRTPRWDQLRLPAEPAPVERERRFLAAETFLGEVSRGQAPGIRCADLTTLYPDRASDLWLTRARLAGATADWEEHVSFAAVDRAWLTAAELLAAVADLLRPDPLTSPGAAARLVRPREVLGPRSEVPALTASVEVDFEAIVQAAEFVARATGAAGGGRSRPAITALGSGDRPAGHPIAPPPAGLLGQPAVPSGVPLGGLVVRPEEYLLAALRALRSIVASNQAPATVAVQPVHFRPADFVWHRPGSFGWSIFAPGFDAPQVMAHARRQAWTLKPARLAPR
ncbi:MAG: hypothetical protein IT204_23955 [Fimbriimonadaceae bacterium]|nr:hypothetical protein [Fimbriimonadaceae bacterium]